MHYILYFGICICSVYSEHMINHVSNMRHFNFIRWNWKCLTQLNDMKKGGRMQSCYSFTKKNDERINIKQRTRKKNCQNARKFLRINWINTKVQHFIHNNCIFCMCDCLGFQICLHIYIVQSILLLKLYLQFAKIHFIDQRQVNIKK